MTNIASRVEVLPATAARAALLPCAPALRRGRVVVRPLSELSGALALVLLPDLLL
jgi:hypothetical protein